METQVKVKKQNTIRQEIVQRLREKLQPLKEEVKNTVIGKEKELIDKALEIAGQNKSLAAELLDIDRKTLYIKLNQFKSC